MKILSGDIGGTKTRLALLQQDETGSLHTLREAYFPNADYPALEPILQLFLDQLEATPQAAGFSLAGPVHERQCRMTNLPWHVSADKLESTFRIPRVVLLNDLEATAWGIGALPASDFHCLQPGLDQAQGNQAVIAAGTGLGQAGLYWDGIRHHPFATEGGHSDFAPTNEQEFALLQYLQAKYTHVSWERVVSGPGLVDMFHFLSRSRNINIGKELEERMQHEDPAAVIANEADAGRSEPCVEALKLFSRLYGAECGNQALKQMATGGIYIGGGIAPKILPWLSGQGFMDAFRQKGQMQHLMEKIPVSVIRNERTAVLGPAVQLLTER